MGLFRPSFRAFTALGEALGLLEADSATTEFENGPVRPRLNVQASLEAGIVRYSKFVFSRTDIAGGASTTHLLRVHVLGDWDEIANRARTLVGVAGSAVPPSHDAWIIGVGLTATNAAFTTAMIFDDLSTVVASSGITPLYFGDTRVSPDVVLRNATHDDPVLRPLPWWVPPRNEQPGTFATDGIQLELVTSGVNTTNVTFSVLSAPKGIFQRLY